ncbi:MAG: homoserine dehydrogenase [Sulfuricurvum sp.]|uniref:homoserine dehydrogenase n=1 Tax=Sulfuricurvum sp. TaxID=2025608 RepID=UPI0035620E3F
MKQVNVLLIGLGRMGSRFFDKFVEVGNERVNIIAVCESVGTNPKIAEAKEAGIAYYDDFSNAIRELGASIDIIMDTSNRPEIKQAIRQILQETDNHKTVLIPMVVDYLMWYLLPGNEPIPQDHTEIGY